MKKLWELIRVLFRCGKVGKSESKSSSVGDIGTLVTIGVGIAMVVAMFFGGAYAAEHQNLLGSAVTVFTTVMSLSGVVAFFLTFFNVMNQLYIASDLDVLVTLPFTPGQLVFAKMVSVSVMPACITFGLTVPASIGYFVKAQGMSALFIPLIILGALLLTLYAVSVATILVMVLMRMFRFIRSRNMISIISAILLFGVSVVYIVACNNTDSMDAEKMTGMFNAASQVSGSLGFLFPTVGFTMKAVEGEMLYLLYAVGIVAVILVLLALCAKAFYFKAALGMTDANGKRGPVKDSEMQKYTAKASLGKTLRRREIKQILATPALITNGYLYSIAFPLLMLIPIGLKIFDEIKETMEAAGEPFSMEALHNLVYLLKLPDQYLLVGGCLFCMFMASAAVGFSVLSRFMISREGKDFAVLQAMPLPEKLIVMVKRNVVLLFNGVSGIIFPAIIMIALAVLGIFPWWVSIVCIVDAVAWTVTFVDFCANIDVNKPNLNWENEAAVTKNNVPGIVLFFISFAIIIGSVFLILWCYDNASTLLNVVGWIYVAVPVAAAVICDIRLNRAAAKLYSK